MFVFLFLSNIKIRENIFSTKLENYRRVWNIAYKFLQNETKIFLFIQIFHKNYIIFHFIYIRKIYFFNEFNNILCEYFCIYLWNVLQKFNFQYSNFKNILFNIYFLILPKWFLNFFIKKLKNSYNFSFN